MNLTITTPKSIAEAAKIVGVGQFRLLEMFSEKLDLPGAMGWEAIPTEYEYLLEEFIDAEEKNFISEAFQEVVEEAPKTPENPQEDETPAPSPKRGKKASTALTKGKSEAIQGNNCKTQKLATTGDTLQMQTAVKRGQIKGTKKAILELQAEQATYDAIVAARLKQDVASLAAEIAEFAGFDPNQILSEAGINLPNEIYEDLQQTIEPKLNLLDESISEITSTDWLQSDFFAEMDSLETLLNSKISEIDC